MIGKTRKNYLNIIFLFLQYLLGIYGCILNTEYIETNEICQIFIRVKCGVEFDFIPEDFTIGVLLNLINILISVVLIPMIISKDYTTALYYAAIRYGKYSRFFIRIVFKCMFLSLLGELLFDIGAVTAIIIKFDSVAFIFDKSILLLIMNFFITIFLFSLFGTIISILISEKVGILLSVSLIIILSVLIFYFPNPIKQLDIITWLYIKEFAYNKNTFTFDTYNYYLLITPFIILEYALGLNILKKNTF